jgi:hypothetical protein
MNKCPPTPFPPGFALWKGPVPQVLTDWAISIRDEIAKYDFGTMFGTTYEGQDIIALVCCHEWTYINGRLVTGLAIKGVTLFKAIPSVALTSFDPAQNALDVPDQAIANFDPPQTDWGLVLASGAAAVGVVTLFWLAVRGMGSARAKRAYGAHSCKRS